MRLKAPDRMDVIKKEDKEARLVAFISKDLAARTDAAGPAASPEYLLVLRSAESPVARALASEAAAISAAGIAIRIVLVQVSPETVDRDVQQIGAFASGVRIVRDIRLLDAHEQLVLNTATAWIGDCMRRDPAKRDAFEQYADARSEVAAWATVSFNRLWRAGEPLVAAPTVLTARQQPEPELDTALIPPADEIAAPEIATRH